MGTDAGCAQFQRLFDTGHGKAVGRGLQRLRATHGPMPVGIGLDHRQCLATAQLASQPIVVAQGIQMDERAGRTHQTPARVAMDGHGLS